MYTDDKTALYLAALLKQAEIKKIIACPGSCNSSFNFTVQEDSFFECYSVSDERSAAYLACGMSRLGGAPVVITSTGATASRNFIPALTEAYYRKLPIIVLAFQGKQTQYCLGPQRLDHSQYPSDIQRFMAELPMVFHPHEKNQLCVIFNAGLASLKTKGGPIWFFPFPRFPLTFKTTEKPDDVWVTQIYKENFESPAAQLNGKSAAIFIGEHPPFDQETQDHISDFATSFNIPVYVDQTSNYYGKNKVLISRAIGMRDFFEFPELIIDMGGITGDYSDRVLFERANIWRISPDGEFYARLDRPVEKLFINSEKNFFEILNSGAPTVSEQSNGFGITRACEDLKIPDLPLGAGYIALQMSKNLPSPCILHLGILNALRNFNFFPLPQETEVLCNVGGFGIDGSISTFIGQCLTNPDLPCFAVIGDLAFFYDMNVLGNKHIPPNCRILLINNNNGEEFALHPQLGPVLGNKVKPLISADGHFKGGAKAWVESCGIKYLSAKTKEEFDSSLTEFLNSEIKAPLVFEVFTTDENEKLSLRSLWGSNRGNQRAPYIAPPQIDMVADIIKNNERPPSFKEKIKALFH